MVAVFSFMGLIAAFAAPSVCARMRNPFPIVVGCALAYAIGFTGLFLAPMAAPILWVVVIGLGPSTFPMSLTLINLRTRTHTGSAALSGFTQGIGYTVACIGPLLFGVLHESTGGWGAPFALLGVAVVVVLISAWAAQAAHARGQLGREDRLTWASVDLTARTRDRERVDGRVTGRSIDATPASYLGVSHTGRRPR